MIAKPAKRLASRLYSKSPSENIAHFRRKLVGVSTADTNQVLGDVLALQSLPKLLAWKLRHLSPCRLLLLGDAEQIAEWQLHEQLTDVEVKVLEWDWQDQISQAPTDQTHVIICRAPTTASHWQSTDALRSQWGTQLHTLGELLLDFTRICELQKKLGYAMKTFDELTPYYLGEATFGPLDELNALFPLAGKRVVEFGCYDGCQTLGLTHLGASVTAVEARAENALKTRAAADAFGLESIRIVMDDFHNAVAGKYGRFDLAFAHGVYYHSVAPLTFLANLVDLSDNVFVGGYCATDNLPSGPWETLSDGEYDYRVKPYVERTDYSAGVNTRAYYFHKEDLQAFYARRGFEITVMSDHPLPKVAGCFYRFLARKPAS